MLPVYENIPEAIAGLRPRGFTTDFSIAFEKIAIGSLWQVFYFLLVLSLFFVHFQSFESFLHYFVFLKFCATTYSIENQYEAIHYLHYLKQIIN